jgi:hypothetical protein
MNPESNVRSNSYRHAIAGFSKGQWMQVPRSFLHFLTRDEAIALAALFDKADRVMSKERIIDGWFFYTMEDMLIDTGMDRNVQQRAINGLVEKKLIRKTRRGIPAKRFLKFRIKNIKRQVRKAIDWVDEQKQERHKNKIKKTQDEIKHKVAYGEDI